LPWGPRCAPQPVAVGRDPPRTRENTASQAPLSTARARRGRFLESGTHAKVDGKTRGNQANSTPKTTTSSEARKAKCWFSHGNSHIGSSGVPPGTPSLLRKFTMFWRTWASETTCFTVRIKIESSGSLRAAPGGPRHPLEGPRATPPARVAIGPIKQGTSCPCGAQTLVFLSLSGGKNASRPGKKPPPLRKCRVLPYTFLPGRTVCGRQRPTCPNPR